MYRALAFKELRETAWIGCLVFGTLLLVVLDQMGYFSFWGLLFMSPNRPQQPFSPHKIPSSTVICRTAWRSSPRPERPCSGFGRCWANLFAAHGCFCCTVRFPVAT